MSDPLESLRNVKVPLWVKLLGAWRARKRRRVELRRTRLVATYNIWWWHPPEKRHILAWYLLYRRGNKRWYEYKAMGDNFLIRHLDKSNSVYARKIAPWLTGDISDLEIIEYAKANEKEPQRSN